MSISFTVPGQPVPKSRPRFGKGHAYTPRATRDHEELVKAHALLARVKPTNNPVRIALSFFRADRRRCDWDNLSKLVTDALNGLAFRDDSQIVESTVYKGYDPEDPRTVVFIEELLP